MRGNAVKGKKANTDLVEVLLTRELQGFFERRQLDWLRTVGVE